MNQVMPELVPMSFSNNEIGPGPAQQDPLISIQLWQDAGYDNLEQKLPAVRTKGKRRFQKRDVELSGCVGDNQNLLEESSDKDDGNFRPS